MKKKKERREIEKEREREREGERKPRMIGWRKKQMSQQEDKRIRTMWCERFIFFTLYSFYALKTVGSYKKKQEPPWTAGEDIHSFARIMLCHSSPHGVCPVLIPWLNRSLSVLSISTHQGPFRFEAHFIVQIQTQ